MTFNSSARHSIRPSQQAEHHIANGNLNDTCPPEHRFMTRINRLNALRLPAILQFVTGTSIMRAEIVHYDH